MDFTRCGSDPAVVIKWPHRPNCSFLQTCGGIVVSGGARLIPPLFQSLPVDDYQNITVVPFSRYYLNCPIESHYATYNWYHNNSLIKTCNTTHPQQDCFHFIQNVSHVHYGHYVCISEEDGFKQALVKERLVNQLRFMSQKGQATMTLASWLQLLLMAVLVELFH